MKNWRDWPIKTIYKKDFPKNLLEIMDCPEKLFYRGNWSNTLFKKTISIVGSRQMTDYGKEVVENLMSKIVQEKATVISGFMYGVDSEAHRKCLNLGGKTIAVLGNGLNYLYPKENDGLYKQILESGGLVISEYKNDFRPTKWSFPQRNRIVAGIATVGILIIEAKIKSGTLITAKLGMKMNKRIMAVPGNISSDMSCGSNWLIKSGAAEMILEPCDIFRNSIQSPIQEDLFQDYSNLNNLEKNIISILETEALDIKGIFKKFQKIFSLEILEKTLAQMIFKNLITKNGNYFYLA